MRLALQPGMQSEFVSSDDIKAKIFLVRNRKVLLDSDLAHLYLVETKYINKTVHRSKERFPKNFMFQLTREDLLSLRFQIGTSSLKGPEIKKKSSHGGRRRAPFTFTQEGVAMLSGVLSSPRAIEVNLAIMRTFVRLRQLVLADKNLAVKLGELESKYDLQFKSVFDAIRELMSTHTVPRRRILGIGNK